MRLPSYFPLLGSFSMIPDSIGLAGSLPTPWHKPRCGKFPRLRIHLRYRLSQILVETLLCLLSPFLWCPTLVLTYRKHYKFSTCLIISASMLASLQGVETWKRLKY